MLSLTERQALTALVVLIAVAAIYIVGVRKENARAEKIEADLAAYQESIKPFLSMALASKSFAIYDATNTSFIYKSHAEKVLPLASLAKVLSAVVILEHTTPEQIFEIEKSDSDQTGDNGLLVGEKWTRDALLQFTLVASSNDGIHAMARTVGKLLYPGTADPIVTFVDTLNQKAKALNLPSFVFYNESGLDISPNQNGAYGNARDMAKLMAYALRTYPEIFSATTQKIFETDSLTAHHSADNTNVFVDKISGLHASKTGFTNISGGNLVVSVAGKDNHETVIVVLGSTFSERFTDVMSIRDVLSAPAP